MNLTNWELIKGNRNFRNLLAGQYVSELGNWFNFIAGQGIVRSVTGGAVEPLVIFLICRTLPWALLMPFAGTLADRISRWKLMLITDIIRIFLALSFIFVRSSEDLWIIYVGSVLMSAAASLFDGAKSAVTPNLVGKEGLLSGTALMFSSRFLLMALGNALGGIAVTFLSYEVAFVINSLSFLVSAYTIWLIPEKETEKEEKDLEAKAAEVSSEVEEKLLSAYTRIRKSYRNGLAVVLVARNACGGCFGSIPPQMQAEIRTKKKIMTCEHCGRIFAGVDDSAITLSEEEIA